jgi:hypothetical protein
MNKKLILVALAAFLVGVYNSKIPVVGPLVQKLPGAPRPSA